MSLATCNPEYTKRSSSVHSGTLHMAKYLDPTKYSELVQALLIGSADEDDQENAIKITLGELLDVWPES